MKIAHEAANQVQILRLQLECLVEDMNRLVGRVGVEHDGRKRFVLAHRLFREPLFFEQLRQLQPVRRVCRLQLRHPLVDGRRRREVVVLQVVVGQELKLTAGFVGQALPMVELGESLIYRESARIELDDLLVDGDGLDEKAIVGVLLRDLRKQTNRLVESFEARIEIADSVERIRVVGVFPEDLAVLLDRGFQLAPGDVFLGIADDLLAVQRHSAPPAARGGLPPSPAS